MSDTNYDGMYDERRPMSTYCLKNQHHTYSRWRNKTYPDKTVESHEQFHVALLIARRPGPLSGIMPNVGIIHDAPQPADIAKQGRRSTLNIKVLSRSEYRGHHMERSREAYSTRPRSAAVQIEDKDANASFKFQGDISQLSLHKQEILLACSISSTGETKRISARR